MARMREAMSMVAVLLLLLLLLVSMSWTPTWSVAASADAAAIPNYEKNCLEICHAEVYPCLVKCKRDNECGNECVWIWYRCMDRCRHGLLPPPPVHVTRSQASRH
ncbi:hypothetical protein ACLOJK_027974 [Asimina triloba]